MTCLFELEGVGFERDGVAILSDVNWKIAAGEHWVLLGPNGAGKTTLLKIATGYRWQTAGEVLRWGKRLADLSLLRREIGWIANDVVTLIPPGEKGLETVVSGRFSQFGLRQLPGTAVTAEDWRRAEEELESIGCGSLAKKRFGVLSQGERQQVLVARSRMAGQSLLVLDEPCAGMDPGVRERYLAWLNEHLSDASFPTVLMATHHIEEILPRMKRAALIRDGKMIKTGLVDELINAEIIESLYDVRVDRIERQGGRQWPIWHGRC